MRGCAPPTAHRYYCYSRNVRLKLTLPGSKGRNGGWREAESWGHPLSLWSRCAEACSPSFPVYGSPCQSKLGFYYLQVKVASWSPDPLSKTNRQDQEISKFKLGISKSVLWSQLRDNCPGQQPVEPTNVYKLIQRLMNAPSNNSHFNKSDLCW